MKFKTSLLLLLFIILAALLSSCAGGGQIGSSWPGVSVDQNTVFVAFERQVRAINLADGKLKWSFPAEPSNAASFFSSPALSPDGQLLVGGYNHILYSLNPETGKTNWEFDGASNRLIASPLAVEDGIYIPDTSENLFALDLQGNQRWTKKTSGEVWAKPVTDLDCNCIYVSSMDHTVYSFNPADGTLNWQSKGLGGSIVGSPALSPKGVLYVGTFGSQIVAVNAENGEQLWSAPTEGWVWGGPVLSDDRLYVGDMNGNFYAFDAQSGQQVWQVPAADLDGKIVGSPLVLEDRVYFSSEAGKLYSLDKQGQNLASVEVGGKLYTSPVAAGDLILVAPVQAENKELLVALPQDISQWQDGQSVWTYIPEQK
jgi:eukaryotic-like serine/threonine-protein kinase